MGQHRRSYQDSDQEILKVEYHFPSICNCRVNFVIVVCFSTMHGLCNQTNLSHSESLKFLIYTLYINVNTLHKKL